MYILPTWTIIQYMHYPSFFGPAAFQENRLSSSHLTEEQLYRNPNWRKQTRAVPTEISEPFIIAVPPGSIQMDCSDKNMLIMAMSNLHGWSWGSEETRGDSDDWSRINRSLDGKKKKKKCGVRAVGVHKRGFAGILQGAVRTRWRLCVCKPTLSYYFSKDVLRKERLF